MPLPVPAIDNRNYQAILNEALARIPVHNPDRLEETPEGDVVVTIPAKSMTWLINEVLSLGPSAEVLDPPSVRDAVREHLCTMREQMVAGRG